VSSSLDVGYPCVHLPVPSLSMGGLLISVPSNGLASTRAEGERLLLDDMFALPEKIEISALFLGQIHAMLEARDAPPGDAEQGEKLVAKGLRLGALLLGAVPILGEFRRAGLDIVPVETHGLSQIADAPPILKCLGTSRRTKSPRGFKNPARPYRRPDHCYFDRDRCKRVSWPT